MVGMDTMAIGGSDIAKDLLRVRKNFFKYKKVKFIMYLQQMEEMSEYKSYKIITLHDNPDDNCVFVNDTVLHLPADHRYGESIRVILFNVILFQDNNIIILLDFNKSTWSHSILW